MLIHLVISLIAVIAFAIFEYSHNKATYSIKTAWVKYVAGLVLGTFGFSYLLKWPVFQYVLQAAFVVAFLFFFWVILQKFKIKGVPGQPLKVVTVGLLLLGATSCQDYDNAIQGNPFPAQQVCFRPLDAATIDSARAGLVVIDSSHAGNPSIAAVMVTVSPSWKQAWQWSGDRNNQLWFWVGLAILIAGAGAFIILGNKGDATPAMVVGLCVVIIIGGALMYCAIGWEKWNMDQSLPLWLYKQFMQSPGNLGPFWDTIRIK